MNAIPVIAGAIFAVIALAVWLLNKYVTKPKSAVVPKTLVK